MPSRGCKLPIAGGVINFSAIRSVPLYRRRSLARDETTDTLSIVIVVIVVVVQRDESKKVSFG